MLTGLAVCGPPTNGAADTLELSNCLIAAVDEIDVPAKRAGMLTQVHVKIGDEVAKDQQIVALHAQEAEQLVAASKLDLQIAEKEAVDNNRVKAAEFSSEVSAYEHQQMLEVREKNIRAVSPIDLKKAWLQMKHSEIQVLLAQRQFLISQFERDKKLVELSLAESQLRDRTLSAPRSGMVVQRYREPGEWVQQGEPIVRLVRLDRLRVEGFVSEQAFAPSDILGAAATVEVRFAGKRSVVIENCTISFTASELEPNGDYRVWTEVTNHRLSDNGPWLLLPGMTATLKIKTPKPDFNQPKVLRFQEQ